MKTKLFFVLAMLYFNFTLAFVAGGITYNITSSTTVEVAPSSPKYVGAIVIPISVTDLGITYSVTKIADLAFNGCNGVISITIPNSVTTFGVSSFSYCTGLTSIALPNSLTEIGVQAFSSCTGLTMITIPNSVTTIGGSAFTGCKNITSISIPNSVTTIGGQAFYGCAGLTSISIPNLVTTIGNALFQNCTGLTSVTIPNSVNAIGDQAFYGCKALTSITIPAVVNSIGIYSFFGCTGLTSIKIPNMVTSIGYGAFLNCTSLTSVTCDIVTPLVISPTVFQGVNQPNCTLYVPIGSVPSYHAAAVWQNFAPILANTLGNEEIRPIDKISIFPNPATDKIFIKNIQDITSVKIYNSEGRLVKNLKTNSNTIDVSNLKSGTYYLEVVAEKRNYRSNFIKN